MNQGEINFMERRLAVGIDIGGTFTDVWVMDLTTEEMWKGKVSSTPKNFSECFMNALQKASQLAQVEVKNIVFIVHGSTIATNTVVTKEGAKIALITTEGFKDVLQIGTTKRDNIYDLFYKKSEPLVSRNHRFEVRERIDWNGKELIKLDEDKVREIVKNLEDSFENICICLLHAYVNPSHEKRIEEIIKEENSTISVSCSHKISPVYREYERLSTTVLNGYVMPATRSYLNSLIKSLQERDLPIEPLVITGDGGATVLDDVLEKPVMTFLSGPSSGVAGAAFLGRLLGYNNIVSFDMGGTSCDVSIIRNGEPQIRTESYIGGYPNNLPMVDITTIGAGGGSIAWVDSGGVPHVGPQSAGAEPGPACYGQGGSEPTVTDANLVLGRYNSDFFLGGEKKLYLDLAKKTIMEKITTPLGLNEEKAAHGILKIVNANMANAVKLLLIKSGYDPSEFALMAMGGSAGSHLPFIMDDLNISEVICPSMASVFCAFGALGLPIKHNFATTRKIRNVPSQIDAIIDVFEKLKSQGMQRINKDKINFEKVEFKLFIDARYVGQKFEITIPIFENELREKNVKAILDRFHDIHKAKYTYCHPQKDIEILTFRLTAVGTIRRVHLPKLPKSGRVLNDFVKTRRNVFLNDNWVECPIYDGENLEKGLKIKGPALIERTDTTIIIPERKKGIVDDYGNILIRGTRYV
jgi:N-methylhydantoinase A